MYFFKNIIDPMDVSMLRLLRRVCIVTITGGLGLPLWGLSALAQEMTVEPVTTAPTESYFSAQVSPSPSGSRAPNVFIPPETQPQVSVNLSQSKVMTATAPSGDRPELRDIMRLDPSPFPNFIYE